MKAAYQGYFTEAQSCSNLTVTVLQCGFINGFIFKSQHKTVAIFSAQDRDGSMNPLSGL